MKKIENGDTVKVNYTGKFEDGYISQWLENCEDVIRFSGAEKLVLVGSCLGGWMMLHLILSVETSKKNLSLKMVLLLRRDHMTFGVTPKLSFLKVKTKNASNHQGLQLVKPIQMTGI